jgi:hypothetical protein
MNQAMEVEKISTLALLLVLALCMSQPLTTNAWIPSKVKFFVHIENGLSSHTLQAHCKSGDQDLGLQKISLGEEFQWGFRPNFFWTTLYFCNLSWVGGHKTFDAFRMKYEFFYPFCGVSLENRNYLHCVWRAQDDGMYLWDVHSAQYYFQYKWEHL